MIDRVPWDDFKANFRWSQGEHVTAIAPSGAGKTTLIEALSPYRKFNVIFGTKQADPLYNRMIKNGFVVVENFSDIKKYDRNILLWPRYRGSIPEFMERQRQAFKNALDRIVQEGGWTLILDESKYIAQHLGLAKEVTFCVNQLRSNKSSVVCGAQRPAWVPPDVLSNATHFFLWKTTNREDQMKLADIGGIDAKEVREEAKSLGDYEFIYINTRGTKSKMLISQVDRN